jgi:hypothetical protein
MPSRVEGRETIAVHHTDDPEVIIVEVVTHGTMKDSGKSFAIPCAQVFRIRDGQVVLFRDYAGPAPH